MYCKYLSKSLNGKIRCKFNKTSIYITECKTCLNFEPKANKGINKKTSKLAKLENNRFSIFTNDFTKCYYCHKQCKTDLHEVYGGSNRITSIKNGLVVPLCRQCHSNENIIMELKAKLQKEYEKNHTRTDFIKIIGKSYIKEE